MKAVSDKNVVAFISSTAAKWGVLNKWDRARRTINEMDGGDKKWRIMSDDWVLNLMNWIDANAIY